MRSSVPYGISEEGICSRPTSRTNHRIVSCCLSTEALREGTRTLSEELAPRLRASIQSPLYERTCMGTHDRQIFLNLDRHARFNDAPAAVRTHVLERHVDDLVDAGWRPTTTVAAVSATRARPASRGFSFVAPFENGAAWRFPARRV